MERRFKAGELELLVEHEPTGLAGGCIAVGVPKFGIKLRVTLEDAESIGEALIACVRAAELTQEKK